MPSEPLAAQHMHRVEVLGKRALGEPSRVKRAGGVHVLTPTHFLYACIALLSLTTVWYAASIVSKDWCHV